jgi:hypothetical protein
MSQDCLDICIYIDTARKDGTNAMDVLHHLMLGPGNGPRAHSPCNRK